MKRSVFLNNVLEIQNGFAFDSALFNKSEDGMPIIRIRDLARGFSETYYNGDYDKRFVVKRNDMLIGMDGEFRCYLWQGEDALLNQRVCRLQNFSSEVNSKYIYYLINKYLVEIENNTAFVTVKHISSKQISAIHIPLPPLPEQERIVRLLDEAESMRATRERANVRMEQFVPALFQEMFGDPVRNDKKWDKKVLTEFGAVVRYGLGQPPAISEEGIPMLRATNIKRGKISTEGLIYVRREDVPSGRNAFLEADEILVVRSGAYTGDIARVGEEWKGAVAGYDLVVNPGDMFDGEFLASYLLTNFVQKEYFSSMKQRAAQPHINAQQVGNTPVFCPPLALQREFAARVEEARGVQSAQGKSAGRVEALYQSMLARAFAGEL